MRRYLLLSDLHCGSNLGIMPREVSEEIPTSGDHAVHIPSKSQLWLLERWDEMLDSIAGEKIDVCVFNGDSCDGIQRKSGGYMLWTSNCDTQVQSAAELLRMTKAKRYLLTMGSGYHVGEENMSLDECVAKRLERTDNADFGVDLVINDVEEGFRAHLSHDINLSNSSWQNPSTPLARELLLALQNQKEFGSFDVLVRSHAHHYCMIELGSHIALITPGWQLRTPYEAKIGLSMLPQIGYVLMEVQHGRIWKEKKIWSPKSPIREVRI